MPPGPQQRSSTLLAEGAKKVGLHPYPFPMMINSQYYDGRPGCINCGHCAGYGCPIIDRGGALVPLRHALLTGNVEIRPLTMAVGIAHNGKKATGVKFVDAGKADPGAPRTESADFVVLAAGPVDTARLALLSGVPDPGDMVGRGLMYHWFTSGYSIHLDERVHATIGRDTSQCMDDFCDPDFPGARAAAKKAGLPYFRGGIMELGGTQNVIEEAMQYLALMTAIDKKRPFGTSFKEIMRISPLRDRMAGFQMIAEDLKQLSNRVDLDPSVKDRYGLAVPRITYDAHAHELAAQQFYIPLIEKMVKESGADIGGAVQQTGTSRGASFTGEIAPTGHHIMGGMAMGTSPRTSATDQHGKLWGLQNVAVADASAFSSAGAHNPTLTIFATTARNARAWAGATGVPPMPTTTGVSAGQAENASGGGGGVSPVVLGVAGAATAAAVTAGVVVAKNRKASGTQGDDGAVNDGD
jgi:gluconate 2-dehydrogenase alpha chain